MNRPLITVTLLAALSVVTPAVAQRPAASATAPDLIRALQGREFTEAFAAAETLGRLHGQRAQVVPALVDALRNRQWATCSADVRDAIGRSLAELKAKEAVGPLLDLVKSRKPLDHECVE
jgi:HEAT repeat protein